MIAEPLFRRLGTRSTAVVWASVLYITHVLLEGKIGGSETTAGFAMIFLAGAIVAGEVRGSLHILLFPLALYAGASSVSSLVAHRHIHAAGELMLWVKIAVFPTALILFRIAPVMRRWTLFADAVLVTGLAVWGMVEYIAEPHHDLEHRITGGETHVMTFSGMLLPLSLLFFVLWIYQRRAWMLVPAAFGSFALLLTFTRSAWLAWIAAMFTLMLLARPRLVLYAAPVVLLFVTCMPVSMFGRLMSSFDTRQESNLDRLRMLQAGREIIIDHPLVGVGPANIKQVYPMYRTHDAPRFRTPHLHNNVVQIWAERGFVALAGYLLLLILFFRECALAWRGDARGWAAAGVVIAAALTFAGVFEFNFGDSEVFYLLLDLFALVVAELEAGAGMGSTPAVTAVAAGLPVLAGA